MIICDKCKKLGVMDEVKNPPEPPVYSMDDIVNGKNDVTHWETADIKWHTRVLRCPYCGFSREYEYGSGGIRPIIVNLNKE